MLLGQMKSGFSIQNLRAGAVIRLTSLLHASPSMLEHSVKFFVRHRSVYLQLCFKMYFLVSISTEFGRQSLDLLRQIGGTQSDPLLLQNGESHREIIFRWPGTHRVRALSFVGVTRGKHHDTTGCFD